MVCKTFSDAKLPKMGRKSGPKLGTKRFKMRTNEIFALSAHHPAYTTLPLLFTSRPDEKGRLDTPAGAMSGRATTGSFQAECHCRLRATPTTDGLRAEK